MNPADPAPASCDTPATAAPAAGAIERAEQRLAMLRRLAELGMQLAEKLTERALSAPADPEPKHDPAESFARVSRAVRLSLALEAKADQDLAALREGRAPAAAAVDPDAWTPPDDPLGLKTRDHPSAHRNRVRDNVWDVINHETAINDLLPSHEVLDDRPLRESVEAICKDLGLTFDASRWTEDGFPPDTRHKRHDWPSMWRPDPKRVEARRLARAGALAASPAAASPPDPHRRQ